MKRLWNYLKAAFFIREKVPLLGDVPVNVMAVVGFIALGFGQPAFWLLGALGETAFLWMLSGSPRFRKVVDALELKADHQRQDEKREEFIAKLTPPYRERYASLEDRFNQVRDYYQKFADGDFTAEENVKNLETLESVFLRLLIAKQHLASPHRETDIELIKERIAELDQELSDRSRMTRAAVESRRNTRDLLEKRLSVFEKRGQAIDEIDADLDQIEAQFQLAADSATIRAKPSDTKLDLDLASNMMTTPEYLMLGEDSEFDLVSGPLTYEME